MLRISGQIQVRWVVNHQHDSPTDDDRSSLEIRRAKIKASGHIAGPRVGFTVGTEFSRNGGKSGLEDAVIKLAVSDDATLWVGRTRPRLLLEAAVSSSRQLAVERSLVRSAFQQDRVTGVMLVHRGERARVSGGVFNSEDGDIGERGWQAALRGSLLLGGSWAPLSDFSSFPGDEPAIAIGAGVRYVDQDQEDPGEPATLWRWTADVSAELGGVTFMSAVVGSMPDPDVGPTLEQYGVVVQGGVFVTDRWELYARYEWGDADGEAPDLSVLTVGFNYFIDRERLKWTADIGYGFNEVGAFWSSSGAGWRTDAPGADGQVVARAQLQLLY